MIDLAAREDRAGVDIHLQRAKVTDVAGRVRTDFGGPGSFVTMVPADVTDQIGGVNVRRAAPDGNARFTFADVTAGRYVLTMNGPGGSARAEITSDVTGALIVLAAQPTELLGAVRVPGGQPATATVVVIFPADQPLTADLGRRLHVVRTQNGGFTITGLPPGKYWAAVGDADMVPGRPVDPARVGPLVRRGVAFELTQGEHRSVQILRSPR